MKKTGLVLILFFIVSTVYSASINCYIPRKGATLYLGQTYTITWLKNGDMEDRVRILLIAEQPVFGRERILSMNNNNTIVLAEEARNDHYQNFFRWTVSDRIPVGKYMIRVMTFDERVVSEGRVFNIKNPEREEGYPDLVCTGRFFVGDKYVNIRKGDTIRISPSDLDPFYRKRIKYDSNGNAVRAVIPFNVNLKNIGSVATGIIEVKVKHLSGKYILKHPELKPGKSTYEKGDYMQMGFDLTKDRIFEVGIVIDPRGKILNERTRNNKFYFVLDLKNF